MKVAGQSLLVPEYISAFPQNALLRRWCTSPVSFVCWKLWCHNSLNDGTTWGFPYTLWHNFLSTKTRELIVKKNYFVYFTINFKKKHIPNILKWKGNSVINLSLTQYRYIKALTNFRNNVNMICHKNEG